MPVLLARAIEDCTDIFEFSGGGVELPLGTPVLQSVFVRALFSAAEPLCIPYEENV